MHSANYFALAVGYTHKMFMKLTTGFNVGNTKHWCSAYISYIVFDHGKHVFSRMPHNPENYKFGTFQQSQNNQKNDTL